MNKIALCLLAFYLSSCAEMMADIDNLSKLPPSFTNEHVMAVHPGMTSDQIQKLFGAPKNISQSVCGQGKEKWVCTSWEYGKFPYDRAQFTFSGNHKNLILNDFKIDRD
jgi:hypothetical protein